MVVYCGNNQPNHAHHLRGFPLKSVNDFRDLGVQRSSNGCYASHIASIATRASRAAGAIRRTFRLNSCELSWPALQIYVLPVLMYCLHLEKNALKFCKLCAKNNENVRENCAKIL